MRLEGRIAIVTGGSRGIGKAIARSYAKEGAKVVIASRRAPGIEAAAAEINAEFPDAVVARTCHTGKVEEVEALVTWTRNEVGVPSVLVNNAGTNPYFGPMLGTSWAAWDKTFEVNLKGAFEATRHVAQGLIEAGQPGSIINIASILGHTASPLQGVYGMTKAAMMSMTRTLAKELGGYGIRVNAIAPGVVDTKLAAIMVDTPDIMNVYNDRSALGRPAQPDEMAGTAVWLASDDSTYVTGQTIFVDGGYASGA
jgi:NAD(P)-dependent dehydrogenase (short-subunit alcohol dehydrogenase family)